LEALPNERRKTEEIVKMIGAVTKGSYNFFKNGGILSGTAYNYGNSLWEFLSEGMFPASETFPRSSV
jgi:hypothetical protein